MASFAYAIWIDPPAGTTPPGNNLNGPVWLFPLSDTTTTQAGNVGISGVISADREVITGITNPNNSLSVYQYGAGKKAVYGLASDPTSWAGYFDERLFAKKLCLPDGADAGTAEDCIASWADLTSSSSNLWTLQTGTTNIYKGSASDLTGMVMIGSASPLTGADAATKLLISGTGSVGPRIYISDTTGNPEIDLAINNAAGNHWGIYTDTTGGSATDQLRFWQGSDRVVFTKTGDVGIGTSAPRSSLDLATTVPVMSFKGWPVMYTLNVAPPTGSGTVTSNIGGINCNPTCSNGFAAGTAVTLSANAQGGSTFLGWGGACAFRTTNLTCPLTMSSDTAVSASFTNRPYTLTISTAGSTAPGAISSAPSGINCGAVCVFQFIGGTTVVLTATPTNDAATGGSYIASWSGGGCSGTGSTCNVSFNSDTTVGVIFKKRVTTTGATNVGSTSATLNGVGNAQSQATTTRFRWSQNNSGCSSLPQIVNSTSLSGTLDTGFSANLTGLTAGQRYYYCAQIIYNGTTVFSGDVVSFRYVVLPPQG